MTEEEVTQKLRGDTEAASGRPGLSDPEVAEVVKGWFYSAVSFSPPLVTPARQARAAAEGWRKQAGKSVAPERYLEQGEPVESSALNANCLRMERRWLDEAERLEEMERRTNDTAAVQNTTSYRLAPTW